MNKLWFQNNQISYVAKKKEEKEKKYILRNLKTNLDRSKYQLKVNLLVLLNFKIVKTKKKKEKLLLL